MACAAPRPQACAACFRAGAPLLTRMGVRERAWCMRLNRTSPVASTAQGRVQQAEQAVQQHVAAEQRAQDADAALRAAQVRVEGASGGAEQAERLDTAALQASAKALLEARAALQSSRGALEAARAAARTTAHVATGADAERRKQDALRAKRQPIDDYELAQVRARSREHYP